jgi:hypothetical protein
MINQNIQKCTSVMKSFSLFSANGQVKVGKDLTLEFSYYFNMNLCVYDRRHREVCHDLNITLCKCLARDNPIKKQNGIHLYTNVLPGLYIRRCNRLSNKIHGIYVISVGFTLALKNCFKVACS